jgi:restriction endonuclease Mrr
MQRCWRWSGLYALLRDIENHFGKADKRGLLKIYMAIPDYETIMLPLLQALADDREHSAKEVRERVAEHFRLTQDELAALQPSGRMPLYNNRSITERNTDNPRGTRCRCNPLPCRPLCIIPYLRRTQRKRLGVYGVQGVAGSNPAVPILQEKALLRGHGIVVCLRECVAT